MFGSYRENDKAKSTIKVTFRSCIAKGLRGAGNIVVILDEAAHFIDAGQSSAEAVWKAVRPSISAFSPKNPKTKLPIGNVEAKVVLISSPLGRQGLFYQRFQIGMRGGLAGKNILSVQAPTWEVNPTVPPEELETNYVTDTITFYTEYGGEFTDRTRGWLEKESALMACVNPDRFMVKSAAPRKPHFMGLDFALAQDATAVAIGHIENGKIVVDMVDQIRAGEGLYKGKERLEFEDVANWVFDISRKFYISKGIFDQWCGMIFEQILHKKGLRQIEMVNFTKVLNSQMYKTLKDLIYEKGVEFYTPPKGRDENEINYLQEMLTLQAEYHSKYIITVEAPNIDGAHDDRSDALARMVWVASQDLGKQKHVVDRRGEQGNPHQRMSPHAGSSSYRRIARKARLSGSVPERMVSRPLSTRRR
jgi:hypothetical protein